MIFENLQKVSNMKNNKRLKLNQNDKEILTIFWNGLSVEERIQVLGSFVSIVYVLRTLKHQIIPKAPKLFKWLSFVLRTEKEIMVDWKEITKFYFKKTYNVNLNEAVLPTQKYVEDIVNNVDDATYNHILQGGKLTEMWSKK